MDSLKETTEQALQNLKTSQPFSGPTLSEERKPCPHGTMCRVDDDGTLCLWECGKCEDEKEQKRKEAKNHQEMRYAFYSEVSLVGANKIPKRFEGKTLENYIAKNAEQKRVLDFCQKYLDNFSQVSKNGVSIVFCGKPGTGKTHLAYAIANALRKHYHTAVVKTAADITADVKSAYKSDNHEITPQTKVLSYTGLDLLVVDEVGVQVDSDSERRIFFDIMNKRYEDMAPTIMISNLALPELTAFAGERVIDRMKEGGGTVFAFDWNSYR